MKKPLIAVGIAFTSMAAFAQMSPEGLWRSIDDETKTPKAEIRITADANKVLTGKIERSLIKSNEPNCGKCTDDRKDKPKVGMEIIRGAKKSDGKELWEGGEILDPENGKNYTLRMAPLDGGKQLQVRGYIGPFYRTQIWQRVE